MLLHLLVPKAQRQRSNAIDDLQHTDIRKKTLVARFEVVPLQVSCPCMTYSGQPKPNHPLNLQNDVNTRTWRADDHMFVHFFRHSKNELTGLNCNNNNQIARSSPGLPRKDAGLMNVKGHDNGSGSGASSGSAAGSPLYPTNSGTNGDAGAVAGEPNPFMDDGSTGIPLGLSRLGREDLEVGSHYEQGEGGGSYHFVC